MQALLEGNCPVMTSIMERKKKQWIQTAAAVCFWLLVWQTAAFAVGQDLLLVSPVAVAKALFTLVLMPQTWITAAQTTARVLLGFAGGVILGTGLAALAFCVPVFKTLFLPLMRTVRSIPLASFVILALLWLKNAGNLSVFISFLMVLPLVYANVLSGIESVGQGLPEMARAFRFSKAKTLRYLYLPAAAPHFFAACEVGVGLSWKSGIAAELIGITANSIGERLYDAKLLFATADLFAWTVLIVALSFVCEKLVLSISRAFLKAILVVPCGHAKVPAPGAPKTLWAKDIVFGYDGESILSGVSAGIEPGECICVTAPSGKGKTTFLNILLGLKQPSRGQVGTLYISALFQENRLLDDLSAVENIALVSRLCREEILRELDSVGLVQEQAQRRVKALSGGQRRRVAILRAMLADDAEAIVMDEPLKGLDAQAKEQTAQSIVRLQKGRPMLVMTHDRNDADLLHGCLKTWAEMEGKSN